MNPTEYVAALKVERAACDAAGKTDRVDAIDAELARLDATDQEVTDAETTADDDTSTTGDNEPAAEGDDDTSTPADGEPAAPRTRVTKPAPKKAPAKKAPAK